MPDFGVTDEGFVLPSQQDLLALVVADQKATIGQSLDTSSDSPIGQLNGVFTRQLQIAYEGLQVAFNANDPDAVEGFLLTSVSALTGTARDAATYSQVDLSCTLTSGTTLIAGTTLAGISGNPASQWTPVADYTATSDGTFSIRFRSLTTGPNHADAGTIIIRTTPVTGWTGSTNPLGASVGSDTETDPDLRARREQELQGGGAGNVDAIRSALLKINEPTGPFILSVFMLNNTSDSTDANGLPPHSTEAVIWDNIGAPVSNNAIAQVLWDKGSSGIRNFGTSSGTATDALGNPQIVHFTRVTQIPVYLALSLTPRALYPGDLLFKQKLSAICNGPDSEANQVAFGVGVSVDPYDIIINSIGLSAAITGLTLGLSAPAGSPASISPTTLTVAPRQIAVFDASRITVNGA